MQFSSLLAGDYGEEGTPVPIPNTEVKLLSGDGTAAEGRGRVARCQPFFSKPVPNQTGTGFFVWLYVVVASLEINVSVNFGAREP